MKPATEPATLAQIPTSALAALAPLRKEPGVAIHPDGDRTWVFWRLGDTKVLRCLLSIPGVRLFVGRDGRWYPPGGHLPAFDAPPPDVEPIPLHRALTPGPVAATPAPINLPPPVRLTLTRDDRPRPTSALRCLVADLAPWADAAPSFRIEAVRGARSGSMALLIGPALPMIAGAERFWGQDVLVPIGFIPVPDWPEAPMRRALGIDAGEVALIGPDAAVEVIPRASFRDLTRAGLRLAIAEATGGGSP